MTSYLELLHQALRDLEREDVPLSLSACEVCVERGWMERVGIDYQLTDAGRDVRLSLAP